MKVYAIHDGGLDRAVPIGYLYCYEKAESYIIELCSDLTQCEAPLLFQGLVKRGIYTIPRDISMLWVKERVIPSGRQNIGLILKNANLREYSERTLLSLSKARCSQDECYISEIKEGEIPDDIAMRSAENVAECFPSEDGQMICLFRDNLVSKVDLNHIAKNHKEIEYVIGNEGLLNTVKIGVGGYSIVFNDSIEILVGILICIELKLISEIKETVSKRAKEYGAEKIYLFGSYARGEATDKSDVDLRIDKGKIET